MGVLHETFKSSSNCSNRISGSALAGVVPQYGGGGGNHVVAVIIAAQIQS